MFFENFSKERKLNEENKKKIADLSEKLRDGAEEQRIAGEMLKNLEKTHNEKVIYLNEKVNQNEGGGKKGEKVGRERKGLEGRERERRKRRGRRRRRSGGGVKRGRN